MKIRTRQHGEISLVFIGFDKIFIDFGAFFVHLSHFEWFWVIPDHRKTNSSNLWNFFLCDLLLPVLFFYDIMFANNFLYRFWASKIFIANFWFSNFAIMRSFSDITSQNQWKSIKINKNHWFSLILAHNIWEATHYRENWKSKVRDEIFKCLNYIKQGICEHNIIK